jgi:hypothetical protein
VKEKNNVETETEIVEVKGEKDCSYVEIGDEDYGREDRERKMECRNVKEKGEKRKIVMWGERE